MSKHHLCMSSPLHHVNLLTTPDPVIVISGQPTLRCRVPIVFLDMVLIAGENPRPTVVEVDLHDTQTWRMTRGVVNIDAWGDLQILTRESSPIQIQSHIFRKVYTQVRLCGDAEKGVL